MRRLLLAATLVLSGCNAILDIPERELASEEDSSADTSSDTSVDSTLPDSSTDSSTDSSADDTQDSTADSSLDAADSTVDSSVDSATDSSADTKDSAIDSATDSGADTKDSAIDSAVDTTVVDSAADTVADSATDTSVVDSATDTGTDVGTDVETDTGPSCGVVGKPCCGVVAATCSAGAVCDGTNCVAATNTCVRPSDCTGTKVCGGPTSCGVGLCDTCVSTAGVKTAFQSCTGSNQCASGLCDQARAVCTTACSLAISGDADCAALGSNVVCTELDLSSSLSDGGTISGRLGYCARSCRRDGECTTGEVCLPSNNFALDRIDAVCAPPRTMPGTKNVGETCTTSADCKAGACLTFGSNKYCSSFCQTGADCGGSTPTCGTMFLIPPSTVGSQAMQMCKT